MPVILATGAASVPVRVAAILKKIGANAIMCCGHRNMRLTAATTRHLTWSTFEPKSRVFRGTAPGQSLSLMLMLMGVTLRRGARGDLVR